MKDTKEKDKGRWRQMEHLCAHWEPFTVLTVFLIIYSRMRPSRPTICSSHKNPACLARQLSRNCVRVMTLNFSVHPVGFRGVFTNHRVTEFPPHRRISNPSTANMKTTTIIGVKMFSCSNSDRLRDVAKHVRKQRK